MTRRFATRPPRPLLAGVLLGAVGGIMLKALAARAAGADVFLVPAANYAEAAAHAGPMRVVPVGDLRAAMHALSALPNVVARS